MLERGDQFTAVIGASKAIEELRRGLVRRGLPHAGASSHLRGLRRLMVEGLGEFVIVCIAVDRTTLDRHGRALRTLISDLHGLPGSTFSVGLVTDGDPGPLIAELGCDMYVGSSAEATDLIHLLRTESDLTVEPGGRATRLAPVDRRGPDDRTERRTDRWHLPPHGDIDSVSASLSPPRSGPRARDRAGRRLWMCTRHRWRRQDEGDWMN